MINNKLIQFRPHQQEAVEANPIPRPEQYVPAPIVPLNVITWICEQCKFTCDDQGNHGWFRDVNGKAVPCSACTQRSLAGIRRRKADKFITLLVQDFKFLSRQNLPVLADDLSIALYPKRGDQNAKKKVQAFIDGITKELLLTGDVGRGKSGLAIAAVKELASQGVQVLFIPMKQYVGLLQENYGDGPDNHIKDICKLVDVLVIDDLGTERVTDSGFTVEETQELLEARHAAGLRTLITTNYSLQGLGGYWYMPKYERAGFQPGARLVSRLQGWYEVVAFNGPDLRVNGKSK